MRVVFVGPSLAGCAPDLTGLDVRGPARQGDLFRAVADGAIAIGLIDGYFDQVAAVWHKEILHALSHGVAVLGAASMGALRAAECAAFGMVPVGRIAHEYLNGMRSDDGDVALVSLPAEVGHLVLTEPLVNVEATTEFLLAHELIDEPTCAALMARARSTHFASRSRENLLAEHPDARTLYDSFYVDQKARDASLLLDELRKAEGAQPQDWAFNMSPAWRSWVESASAGT